MSGRTTPCRALWRSLLAVVLSIALLDAGAGHVPGHRVVDGVELYLGAVPAEMLRGHPPHHAETWMHGGQPPVPMHHVSVAIFDRDSGKRLDHARVEIQVLGAQAAGPRKALDPMVSAGARMFGGYFAFPAPGPQRIRVWVYLPQRAEALVTEFAWGRA